MHRIEAYVTFAVICIVAVFILYLPVLFIIKKKGIRVARQLSCLAFFCSVALILFATVFFVFPVSFKPEQYVLNLLPFQWLTEERPLYMFITEVIPNIMLFIPFGIFLPAVFRKARRFYITAFVTFCVTFGVEFFQFFIGRSSDIDDIIANLLGGMAGYGIYAIAGRLFRGKGFWTRFIGPT